jgi:Zn-finger protein
MADFRVIRVSALALSASKSYQTLHVSIRASARDVTVPAGATDEEKQEALADAPRESFTEVYSFTRKLGVKTNTSRDWLKGECPNCGYVPEHFSENNKCRSCGSIYNSGEFDWVLSEITQQEEWKEDSSREIAGLAELEGRNLSINREVIEDRASYLFWRWIYARIRGTSAPLARDASPEFIAAFPAQKHTLINTAVGAVDLVSVALEGGDAVAKVKVLWSTASEINDEPYHREHLFTLKMPVALKNPYGLADHSCDNCGAPLPETDALKCSYCGSGLPAAVNDWILVRIDEIDWEKGQTG